MDVRDALLQRIRQRIMRLRQAFERFGNDAAEREMVGPRWNVRDLAGHLLFWADEGARQLPRMAAGEALPDYDFNRVNEETYRKYRRMSFVMLRPPLREAEERFLRAVAAVPPLLLRNETPVREAIDAFGLDHYEHHWPGLRAASQRLGGDLAGA
jgi:hypothetical protein